MNNNNTYLYRHRFISHSIENDSVGIRYFMESTGRAFIKTYWYKDDESVIYFTGLSISKDYKRNHLATELLNLCTLWYKVSSIKTIRMVVLKDSWLCDWYKSLGYYYIKDDDDTDYIWMETKIELKDNIITKEKRIK